jgi:heterodisulfide reductase subunit C
VGSAIALKYYNELKKGSHRVKISHSVYRCPYYPGHLYIVCPGKRNPDHLFKEILQYASRVGSSKKKKKTLQTIISRSARARTVEEGIEYD